MVGESAAEDAETYGREGGVMIINHDIAYTILMLIIVCPMVSALFVWVWDYIKRFILLVCYLTIYLLERKG